MSVLDCVIEAHNRGNYYGDHRIDSQDVVRVDVKYTSYDESWDVHYGENVCSTTPTSIRVELHLREGTVVALSDSAVSVLLAHTFGAVLGVPTEVVS